MTWLDWLLIGAVVLALVRAFRVRLGRRKGDKTCTGDCGSCGCGCGR